MKENKEKGSWGNILIADSGGSKTDWHLLRYDDIDKRISTKGLSPIILTAQEIHYIIERELLPQLDGVEPDEIYFYGSGCKGGFAEILKLILTNVFPKIKRLEVEGDMLGAAKALLGDEKGIVAILGTGSNSCIFDGEKIIKNTPPLGYILGDEGSGVALGTKFIVALLRHQLPNVVQKECLKLLNLSEDNIINKIYHEPMANRFLASFAPIVLRFRTLEVIHNMIIENFRLFFHNQIKPYGIKNARVSATGSIAWNFQNELKEAAKAEEIELVKIIEKPINGLVHYYKCKFP